MLVHPVAVPGSGTRSWTVLRDDDVPVGPADTQGAASLPRCRRRSPRRRRHRDHRLPCRRGGRRRQAWPSSPQHNGHHVTTTEATTCPARSSPDGSASSAPRPACPRPSSPRRSAATPARSAATRTAASPPASKQPSASPRPSTSPWTTCSSPTPPKAPALARRPHRRQARRPPPAHRRRARHHRQRHRRHHHQSPPPPHHRQRQLTPRRVTRGGVTPTPSRDGGHASPAGHASRGRETRASGVAERRRRHPPGRQRKPS